MLSLLLAPLPAVVCLGLCVALTLGLERRISPAVGVTFVVGALAGTLVHLGIRRAEAITGLSVRVADAGETGALVFFCLVAEPLSEVAKVMAVWPALLSRRLLNMSDGIVLAAASSLGFAAVETSWELHEHPTVASIVRTALGLPGHVFFACVWGAALGWARATDRRIPAFPLAFVVAVAAHGLYGHLACARGPGSLLALVPLLTVMVLPVSWFLRWRGSAGAAVSLRRSRPTTRWSRLSEAFPPPSLATVRQALAQRDEPLNILWVIFGALVVLGAMFVGVGAGVLVLRWLHLNLAAVDDRTVTTASPLLVLAIGPLASLPASGWLVARARGRRSLLEPALSASLALGVSVILLGVVAPVGVVFALALSPLAWAATWAGAWFGRTA